MPPLTEEEIEERLKSPNNLANRLEIHNPKKGRANPGVPEEIQKTIAVLANDGANIKELAKTFGLNPRTVSEYKVGEVGRLPSAALKEVIDPIKRKKNEAEGLAIDILMTSLDTLGPMVPGMTKPSKLSSLAKDMAVIAEKLRGREKDNLGEGQGMHLHLHIPKVKSLSDYETVEVESR